MSTPLAPEVAPADYTVCLLRPEHAGGVARIVLSIYGDQFMDQELCSPKRIQQLNQEGKLVSAVAVTPNGEVVGHSALVRSDQGIIAELSEAMVLPEHRHHHLFERMAELLESEAIRLGLAGTTAWAVANHPFTQRVNQHLDFQPCGLPLALLPLSYHNLGKPLTQRLGCVLYFKELWPPKVVNVHIPPQHETMCRRIYQQLGVPVTVQPPAPATGPGQLKVVFTSADQVGEIQVQHVGEDTVGQVLAAHRDLCERSKAEVIFLQLPLTQAGTPEVCTAAERIGFFFASLGRYFNPDGDVLRLQCLNVPLDASLLVAEDPFARELLAYVTAERQRVASGTMKR